MSQYRIVVAKVNYFAEFSEACCHEVGGHSDYLMYLLHHFLFGDGFYACSYHCFVSFEMKLLLLGQHVVVYLLHSFQLAYLSFQILHQEP